MNYLYQYTTFEIITMLLPFKRYITIRTTLSDASKVPPLAVYMDGM
jgi:hypothetical protein